MIEANSSGAEWPKAMKVAPATSDWSFILSEIISKQGPGCVTYNQKMNNDCTKSPFTLVEQITRQFFDWWWAAISGIVCHVNERTSSREWSIWNETEGRMGYWLRGHEGERNNCFSKIQLVGQKYRDKTTLASKTRFSRHCFGFQSHRFSLLVGYNI